MEPRGRLRGAALYEIGARAARRESGLRPAGLGGGPWWVGAVSEAGGYVLLGLKFALAWVETAVRLCNLYATPNNQGKLRGVRRCCRWLEYNVHGNEELPVLSPVLNLRWWVLNVEPLE